jgi:hypothetical protein
MTASTELSLLSVISCLDIKPGNSMIFYKRIAKTFFATWYTIYQPTSIM